MKSSLIVSRLRQCQDSARNVLTLIDTVTQAERITYKQAEALRQQANLLVCAATELELRLRGAGTNITGHD